MIKEITEKDVKDFEKIVNDLKEIQFFLTTSFELGTIYEEDYRKVWRKHKSTIVNAASRLMEIYEKL